MVCTLEINPCDQDDLGHISITLVLGRNAINKGERGRGSGTYTCSTVVCCTMLAVIKSIVSTLLMSIVLAHWNRGWKREGGRSRKGKRKGRGIEEGEREGNRGRGEGGE